VSWAWTAGQIEKRLGRGKTGKGFRFADPSPKVQEEGRDQGEKGPQNAVEWIKPPMYKLRCGSSTKNSEATGTSIGEGCSQMRTKEEAYSSCPIPGLLPTVVRRSGRMVPEEGPEDLVKVTLKHKVER